MGFRPSEKGFELKHGAFYNFCKNAEIDSENEYFFIIDEINRGNLSKIFGELFMLIESDKRGVELKLLYSDEKFWYMQFNRNNQTYRMLISVCYLIVKGLLQTQGDGTTGLMDFLDEQRMHRLYEKFILEYYRKEYPQISAKASQIPWQLDDDMSVMLPVMQTDIMLSYGEKILIIDAKYYSHSTQMQYDEHTLHSGNMYQIFTYVKNKEVELSGRPHEVSGMLLYGKTDEEIYPENEYHMSGNRIEVRTLNLDRDFACIKAQLDRIVEKYFGIGVA